MRSWLYRLCKLTAGTSADAALYGAGRDRTWLLPRLSALGQGIIALLLLLGLLGLGNQAEAQVSITQITNTGVGDSPSINADGTKIAFVSDSDLTGGNPDRNVELFLWTQGVGFTQITNTTRAGNRSPSINADGTKIAFASSSDLTGGNPAGNGELFLWTQGVGFTQITNNGGDDPSINADGSKIAFQSNGTLIGGNPVSNNEILLWTQSAGITQITNTGWHTNRSHSINADGTRIAFASYSDLIGGNPDGNAEIFLWTQGVGFTQITSTSTTGSSVCFHRCILNSSPSINADGTRIAFLSDGGNPGGLLLWTQGVGISQITNIGGADPSINADGTKIAFVSSGNLTGENPDGNWELFLWTQGVGFTQITSTTNNTSICVFVSDCIYVYSPSINADGSKIAFKSNGNLTGENPDGNDELFLATVSGTSPPPTTGSLQVTVRRSDTNALLPGASVSLSGGPSSPAPQTTGSNGTAIFSNLEAGNYTVTASLTGFQTGSTTATVSANTTTSAIILLTPTPTTGTLQVTVRRSDTQAALPGVLVTVSSSGTLQSQTTGSSGVTTFSNLQAGSYTVTASLTGFQTSSTTAVVSANTTTSAIISLTPTPTTGTLQVTVRRSDTQAALPGALVTVSSPGTLQSQMTGSNGSTTFSNLQAGSYSLTVSLTGYQTGSTTATVSANLTTSTSISLTPITLTGAWSGWTALPGGGQTGSHPAVVLDSTGTLRLYIQGIDNGLWVKQKSGGSWSDWSRVAGGGSLDGPAAFLDGSAVRLVVRGLDNSLWTALADTPTWEHLGGRTERSPVALMHAGSPFIFIRGLDGRLYEMLRDQTGVWSQWAEVPGGGQSSGQPAAVVDNNGTLHLYIQGIDNSLWTNQVSPTLAWGQWTVGVGGRSSVGPAAILDGDKVRLIIRGLDNRIWTTLASDAQATQWGSWEDLGGQTLNPPAAVRDGNTLHFFIRGIDGRLYMNSRTGGSGASESEQSEE